MNLLKEINDYQPYNQQEASDKGIILHFLANYDDILERTNRIAHITSSCWILNHAHDKVLMAYHKIYDSWAWLGGHNDGESDCLKVAIKEAKEESGIGNIKPLSEEIYSIEVLSVDSHLKRGEYVPTHLHLNVTYLLEADDSEKLVIKEDENSGVAWFSNDEVMVRSSEEWFKKNIYAKLIDKTNEYLKMHKL